MEKKKYGFVIVLDRCIGCMACYAACKTEWEISINPEYWRTKVLNIEDHKPDGTPKITYLPILCNQCSNPYCVDVCPTGASYKREEDGIVLVVPDKCIGCKACIEACPYDARFYDEDLHAVNKCTWCLPRINNGLEPACVNTCVGEARNFGRLDDPDSLVSKLLRDAKRVWKLKENEGTEPNVYYVTLNE